MNEIQASSHDVPLIAKRESKGTGFQEEGKVSIPHKNTLMNAMRGSMAHNQSIAQSPAPNFMNARADE